MEYPVIVIVHLICAILFIGVVFFEVVLLEGVRIRLPESLMTQFEESLIARAKKIMPWVVGTLFLSGVALASFHWAALSKPLSSSFGALLALKIILALSVLAHFVSAMRAAATGCMSSERFQITHYSVAIHMFFIVVLAKLMFYINW